MENRLIIALDVPTARAAREVIAQLRGTAGMYKVGSQLFTAAGPALVREIVAAGERVFLDLKFHDIPNTVAAACVEAARLGVSLVNIHALGGSEMMRRAAEAVRETSARESRQAPALLAVTILTSAAPETLREVGIDAPLDAQVLALARLAAGCGLDGVVASPREVAALRAEVRAPGFLLVTPGVRPVGAASHDQKRTMTPAEAVRSGADYLVVGRAILEAPDPAEAARGVAEEMREALLDGARLNSSPQPAETL